MQAYVEYNNSNGRYFVMKELYTKPVVELDEFEAADVIATSVFILNSEDEVSDD